jgi:2-polyprenyl-6-methoxyphenol hydroxylase-like FAD-dependent oxidoreductase
MRPKTPTTKQVGGSLTGLMNAIALKSQGYNAHVLERSAPAALESEAAGIRVGPEVHSFMERYIPDYPRDYEITANAVEIVDADGKIELSIPPKDPLRLTLRLTTWKTVYDMFKDALLDNKGDGPSATYQTRLYVYDVKENDGQMIFRYRDLNTSSSTTLEADLVIAADSAHSTIRNRVLPGIVPKYAGYVSWRGSVPEHALSATTREALRDRSVIHRVDGGYQIS